MCGDWMCVHDQSAKVAVAWRRRAWRSVCVGCGGEGEFVPCCRMPLWELGRVLCAGGPTECFVARVEGRATCVLMLEEERIEGVGAESVECWCVFAERWESAREGD